MSAATQEEIVAGDHDRWAVSLPSPVDGASFAVSSLSFARFAEGRRPLGRKPELRPRPQLLRDLLPAFQHEADKGASIKKLQILRATLNFLWSFLDSIDDVLLLAGTKPPVYTIASIPELWEDFSVWRYANIRASDSRQSACKHIVNLAATIYVSSSGQALAGFPIPIRSLFIGIGRDNPRSDWEIRGDDRDTTDTWTVSFASLGLGRQAKSRWYEVTARPKLAREMLIGARSLVEKKPNPKRQSAYELLPPLYILWRALDDYEASTSPDISLPQREITLALLPGARWAAFIEYLLIDPKTAYARYRRCKSVCDAAADFANQESGPLPGFPLPPNPFSSNFEARERKKNNITDSQHAVSRDKWAVRGKTGLDIGHGTIEWIVSCAALVEGRKESGAASFLKPRPALGREIIGALRQLHERPGARGSLTTEFHHICRFYKFLDEMEDLNLDGFSSPRSVLEIPGMIWVLFKDWLGKGGQGAHYTYFFCKRTFEVAASQLTSDDGILFNFPLPLNPFPSPQKSSARRPAQVDATLSLEEGHAVSNALFEIVQRVTARIEAQRDEMSHETVRGAALRTWLQLAEAYQWRLLDIPAREITPLTGC